MNIDITKEEVLYLKKQAEIYRGYAELDIMQERTSLWYAHNALKSDRPVVIMENLTFNDDFLPAPVCTTELGQFIERTLIEGIWNHEKIGDDKVLSPSFPLEMPIEVLPFGVKPDVHYSKDSEGREIGYETKHIITDLQADLPKLKPSEYSIDREGFTALKQAVESVIGDILPVQVKNGSLNWEVSPTKIVIDLMGMQDMMFAMFDAPDELHGLMSFIRDDIIRYIRWQEQENLLTMNNRNDYAGSGSYGFTDELSQTGDTVLSTDIWGNLNSQESVGISPDMYGEFIYPYYHDLAKEFGLLYYGCCEPVHDVWEDYISRIPNLRKVSISPWCDQQIMGEYLRGSGVIYSRKPSPNFIGVGRDLDEEAFSAHIKESLLAAKGNTMEIVFRDIYTLEGNIGKPGRAVEIVRELIDRHWS